jgi:hypothetical protein
LFLPFPSRNKQLLPWRHFYTMLIFPSSVRLNPRNYQDWRFRNFLRSFQGQNAEKGKDRPLPYPCLLSIWDNFLIYFDVK